VISGNIRVGVIGDPIGHSLSPRIHNRWLDDNDINTVYEAILVKPEDLESFLRAMPEEGFIGVNVTIPHKESVFKLVDEYQGLFTGQIGAINTIIVRNGKLIGANTDDYGFLENLKGKLPVENRRALVIGAGGAARAICLSLLHGGYEVTLINRTRERAENLAKYLNNINIRVLGWEEIENAMSNISLLVNTTSLGMKGQPKLEISLAKLPQSAVVTDIVYNPVNTEFLKQAREHGNLTVDGLGMLLYQAQMAFGLWFGTHPNVTPELRQYVAEALK